MAELKVHNRNPWERPAILTAFHSGVVAVLLVCSCALSQVRMNVENFRVHPGTMAQCEPVVAVSPIDPNLLFASSYTINTATSFTSEGVYISTDGGEHWFGSDTCTGALLTNHGGNPGVAVDTSGRLILSHMGRDPYLGVYTNYSTNLGMSWSNATTVTGEQAEDKAATVMDINSESPYYGRTYLVWVNKQSISFPVTVSYSTNSGESWPRPNAINDPPPTWSSGGSVAIARDGKVYICWAGMSASNPRNEDYIGMATSTNGGIDWTVDQNIIDMNGIYGIISSKNNILVNGLPQIEIDNSGGVYDGNLYIVTSEKNLSPAGSDPDIILHRSIDSGKTWSPGIRVNQDAVNNGKVQYFPAMAIDKFGAINIIFMDDRNTTTDSAEVVLARSTDPRELEWKYISALTGSTETNSGRFLFSGSTSLSSRCDILQAFWMDDFSGIYQIWTCRIPLRLLDVEPQIHVPEQFELEQNYPNPFNPSTVIRYQLSVSGYVSLKVYTMLGVEVATLINGMQEVGYKSVTFEASGLPSGVYYYRLQGETFTDVKKMIFVR